jgi:outer membrane protein OmpA-like peptidoglycan-associated protein
MRPIARSFVFCALLLPACAARRHAAVVAPPPAPPVSHAAAAQPAAEAPRLTQPHQPRRFVLYFEQGSSDLTAASRAEFPSIVATAREYASADMCVVGHSDTAGDPRVNLGLSLRRAMAVGSLLVAAGIDPGALDITSLGEASPPAPTGDNVPEPRNRCVEVTVK